MRDNRPSNELSREELRERIIKNARRIYAECSQVIRDGESWADNRPEFEPIDFEWARVFRANAAKTLEQFVEEP